MPKPSCACKGPWFGLESRRPKRVQWGIDSKVNVRYDNEYVILAMELWLYFVINYCTGKYLQVILGFTMKIYTEMLFVYFINYMELIYKN